LTQSEANPVKGRIAVFDEPNAFLDIKETSIPPVGEEEILVKISACTICGSDLHTITGRRIEKSPTILGHEIIGHIAAIGGDSVQDYSGHQLSVGDRITWSICISCGQCKRCESGIPQKCASVKKFGHEVLDGDSGLLGGFAEYVLLPASTSIFRISNAVPDEVLCPANCATATVAAAIRQVPKVSSKRVLIIGAGMLGLSAIAFVKTKGASQISVIEPDDDRSKLAFAFGADHVADDISKISERFDIIFDFSGSSSAIEQAISAVDLGGTIVLVGTVAPSPAISIDPEFIVRNLITIIGVHNYHPMDLETALNFLVTHNKDIPFDQLVEKSFPLADINDAVEFALSHKPIRVMIKP